jgi:hypothetical protein
MNYCDKTFVNKNSKKLSKQTVSIKLNKKKMQTSNNYIAYVLIWLTINLMVSYFVKLLTTVEIQITDVSWFE